jgi:DNA sulfur modification protein DndD
MRLAESELPLAQMLSHLDDLKMRQLLSVSQNEYQAINSGVTRFSQILNEEVQKKQIVQYSLIKEFQQICISIQDDYIKSLKVSPFPSRPDEISSLSEKVRGLKSQANLALARYELKKGELDEADRLIAAVPSEEKLSELQAQLAKLESSQVELAKLANDQTEKLSSLRRAREQIERKIDEVEQIAMYDMADAKLIQKIDSIVASGGVSLEKFSEAVRTRQVKNLEDLVLDGFRRLLRKHRFIEKVEIDEKTFKVTIFTEKSVAIPAQKLSAGERQLLAVAVLWALARLSGRELPTVIDTPLGRLDSIHRSRFVEQYFPYAARQVVLLSTDEEIVGEHYDALKPFIAHEYTLDFDEDLRSTTINTGYFANLKEAA